MWPTRYHTCGGPTSWRREIRRGQTLGCVTALTNLLQHQGAEDAEAYRRAQLVVAKAGAPRVMRIAAETNDLKRHKGILGLASAAGAKLPNLKWAQKHGAISQFQAKNFTLHNGRAKGDKGQPATILTDIAHSDAAVFLLDMEGATPYLSSDVKWILWRCWSWDMIVNANEMIAARFQCQLLMRSSNR